MDSLDFTAEKPLYAPKSQQFSVVDVPPMTFLTADGEGDPNTSEGYGQAVAALYSASYALKFASKTSHGRNYVVAPLEGLWWVEGDQPFTEKNKERWHWRLMIRQPDWMTDDEVRAVLADTATRKQLPAVLELQIRHLTEGLSVQTMHIGPYDTEAPVIRRLHSEFLPENGFRENGEHHEIYLSDPRRTRPERLRTILRQPVRRDASRSPGPAD